MTIKMTDAEKWFVRLNRCIQAMPEDIEIAVTDGCIDLLPVGAVQRSFEKRKRLVGRGDLDAFSDESTEIIHHRRIITCNESL